ncbi:MAG: alpha-glucan phosphorylase [Peptococcaceae bacterium BRH_c4b]|nr:MAG: alpha-glucan phosphorylase [Peptococcaceae bacterium BRH_c4b]
MYAFRTISVKPKLPEEIKRLKELAYNFWFSWNTNARALFRKINETLWDDVNHNPVKFLLHVNEEDLEDIAQNDEYIKDYNRVFADFDRYMNRKTWFEKIYPQYNTAPVAYFSAEFGLHESHPIYSGGLGLLAGDHLKSASDLGIPLVGVGLLYRHGYFNQAINRDGSQVAQYLHHTFSERPIIPVADGKEKLISVEMSGRTVYAKVWKCLVGRITLYMLDSNIPQNSLEDRKITDQLYGGDRETRISQEILLGIGGVKALRLEGINPAAWHINEGHAAFLILERIRELVAGGLSFETAREIVSSNTLFTTHTPVPAGHDLFSAEQIERYLGNLYEQLNIEREDLLELGWDEERKEFNMTLLALRISSYCNGVSKLHGEVTKEMFSYLYPGVPVEEVPVHYITNGVHTGSWLAQEIKDLYYIYLGEDWHENITDRNVWKKVREIPDNLLWAVHQSLKEKMISFARKNLKKQRLRNQEPTNRVKEVEQFLRPNVFTIGFARRFATYKRAGLLFLDRERLEKLINNPHMPVQIVFAGKAHPADTAGQELISQVYSLSNEEPFKGKIVFLENYDIHMARILVQGVDIWLNTPRRPMEASGTSGQKAAANGVLNLSILDGWWPEGYNGENGFAIGEKKHYDSEDMQDRDDCYSLYATLEEKVLPAYYGLDGAFPREWLRMMKNSIVTISPVFSTERMVQEYSERFYIPSIKRWSYFTEDNYSAARRFKDFKQAITENWQHVSINRVETNANREINVGSLLKITAYVHLGPLCPDDVDLEVVYGNITDRGLTNISISPMTYEDSGEDGAHRYLGQLILPQGTYGYTVRVIPGHQDFVRKFELPLIIWSGNF